MQKEVIFKDLGTIDYKDALNLQKTYFQNAINIKYKNTNSAFVHNVITNCFFICEHQHVYTIGKNGKDDNLLISSDFLKKNNIKLYKIDRGGDITYHGPGQIVGYPIIDLEYFSLSIKKYIFLLEEIIIQTLNDYDINGYRIEDLTGVWVNSSIDSVPKKICAIGVRVSRYITMHGFALNVNNDLKYFEYINPCGISGMQVTSVEKEKGEKMNINDLKQKIIYQTKNYFY
ncbi:MAG: lipoyl(octanoyl) transferase LipB [Bacteroidia bacterium]|nr:lipoyl(octanoyl) transferase LipB [Bacteroidia bacterium]